MTHNSSQTLHYGRYQVLGELGRGAMGVVYQAHDPQIDRVIALKVLRQDRVTSDDLVQRFLKEAKAIGRLSHPNIVTVYDVGQDHDTIFIAMEFLEGLPLNEVIKSKSLSLDEIVLLGAQVADAVDYAHNKGIVHRDIKSTNIILTPDGQTKITDFGIAHIEDPSAPQQTQAGEILGTPVYMSPEQVMSKPVDGRSDLYSLGVILYELTTGQRPFGGDNLASIFRAITQDDPIGPSSIAPSIPQALSELIVKSLGKEPSERFQTGKIMADALRTCLDSKRPGPQPRQKPDKKGHKSLIISLIVLLAIGSVSLIYFTSVKAPGEKATSAPAHEKAQPVTQVAESGTLKIDSNPLGAQVFVDNTYKGKSPLALDLALGKHDVRLTLSNYYDWEAQIQLRKRGKTPLSVRLMPMEGNK